MKKKKILMRIFIILIILILIAVGAVWGYNYHLEKNNNNVEDTFYSLVFQNNFQKILDVNTLKNIMNKKNDEAYSSDTKVELTNTLENNYNIDLNKLTFELNTKSNSDIINSKFKLMYSNNDLFYLDTVIDNGYIGIKNEDTLNNYIGCEEKNLQDILLKINENYSDIYQTISDKKMDLKFANNENNVFSKSNSEYLKAFKKSIQSTEYSDDGIAIINQNGKNIETHRYSLVLSKNEMMNLYSVLTSKILEDEELKEALIGNFADSQKMKNKEFESNLVFDSVIVENEVNEVYSFRETDANTGNNNQEQKNYSAEVIEERDVLNSIADLASNLNNDILGLENYSVALDCIKYIYSAGNDISFNVLEEDINNQLEDIFEKGHEYIDSVLEKDDVVKISVFADEGKTVKTSILFGYTLENSDDVNIEDFKFELDIDYISNTEDDGYTKITFIDKTNDYSGYEICLSKNKTNIIDVGSIEINRIENKSIVNKFVIKLTIEGSETSNKFKNTINLSYNNGNVGKFTANITNNLTFKNVDVEELNSDNTVLIDGMEDGEFYYSFNKIFDRVEKVYEDKMTKLNLINTNTSDKIFQNNQENVVQESNFEEKEEIIELLVDIISNEMGKAQEEGKEYTLKNLENLKIDGYEVQASISNDLAIITVNNYSFKIDKDFNLSE